MEKYWTFTLQVNEVIPPVPLKEPSGYAVKHSIGNGQTEVVMVERQVIERFSSTVRASSEIEAYAKAAALIEVSRPEEVGFPQNEERHQ